MSLDYIKIDELKEEYLYFIYARNSFFGIWKAEKKSFVISRFKLNLNYLFDEYHWDTGEPFGTVKPLKELEEVPPQILQSDEKLIDYLNAAAKRYSHLTQQFE